MQPITQASLDPKFNDIRRLLAEQSMDGVIRCFGLAILNRRTERVLRCGEGARQRTGLPDLSPLMALKSRSSEYASGQRSHSLEGFLKCLDP